MTPICIVGAGGHGKVVADILIASGHPPVAFVDDAPRVAHVLGIEVRTGLDRVEPNESVLIAIGDNYVREQRAAQFSSYSTAIHPTAVIGQDVEIGTGTVVMAGAVINPGTRIGKHCIVNTRASIDHDSVIEDFCHVAPGATLGGGVRVGRGTAVGLGASVIHGVSIGEYVVIGAGAAVIDTIPGRVVAVGVPARVARARAPGEPYL